VGGRKEAGDKQASIISASIVGQTNRPPVSLDLTRRDDKVIIKWKHLDPGCGFRVLIIFAGSEWNYINAHMSVVGMSSPSYVGINDLHLLDPLPYPDPRPGLALLRIASTFVSLTIASIIGYYSFLASMRYASEAFYMIQAGILSFVIFLIIMMMSFSLADYISGPSIPRELIQPA
jgi:hypothetical protein